MTELRTTITGLPEVVTHLQALPRVIADAQRAEIKALGDRYLVVLQDETPIGKGEQSGRLRAGYQTTEAYSAASASYRIVNVTPHLRFVLGGRGVIVARGRALRFVINSQVFFRKRVGPAAPNAFDARAKARMASDVAGIGGRIRARVIGGGA